MDDADQETFDLIVVGSGAAGFSAAVTGAKAGLDVALLEKTEHFGGTTAYSGGFMWVPNNSLAAKAGLRDSVEDARTYIRHLAGDHFDPERVEAYLTQAPQMLDLFLEAGLCVNPEPYAGDFHSEVPGARRGRAVSPAPVHASILGQRLSELREPLPETTFLGIRIGSGPDMQHFMNVTRSWKSAAYVAKRMLNHAWELVRYGRAMHLVNGNALIAQFAKLAIDAGVQIRLSTPVTGLLSSPEGVSGVEVTVGARRRVLRARKGVVLATGGFPFDLERRAAWYPHPAGPDQHFSLAPSTNTGDGARLAESLGGRVVGAANNGAWMPVTRVPKRRGPAHTFMHSFSTAKAGFIAVTPEGARYVNESQAWQDVAEPMLTARGAGKPALSFLIGDHRAVRKFGLGFAKPSPVPLWPYLATGYLMRGGTLDELARAAGIDPQGLAATIETFNRNAREGRDPEFHRGEGKFSRALGDPDVTPNPTLAPIETPPYYAVKVYPGDIGTFAGIRADGEARVLLDSGEPIPRLYAAGNDMATVFGGAYPGGGGTIGPAATFGFVAARHAASLPDNRAVVGNDDRR
jgi:succinate dehydrogenase/fumarate reductase flavoprotein subunit